MRYARMGILCRAEPDGARPCEALIYGMPEWVYFLSKSSY